MEGAGLVWVFFAILLTGLCAGLTGRHGSNKEHDKRRQEKIDDIEREKKQGRVSFSESLLPPKDRRMKCRVVADGTIEQTSELPSLRDQFAMAALSSIKSENWVEHKDIAAMAYLTADEMLKNKREFEEKELQKSRGIQQDIENVMRNTEPYINVESPEFDSISNCPTPEGMLSK